MEPPGLWSLTAVKRSGYSCFLFHIQNQPNNRLRLCSGNEDWVLQNPVRADGKAVSCFIARLANADRIPNNDGRLYRRLNPVVFRKCVLFFDISMETAAGCTYRSIDWWSRTPSTRWKTAPFESTSILLQQFSIHEMF